jgi:hypothetical protein
MISWYLFQQSTGKIGCRLASLGRANGSPISNYFATPWKCRAPNQVFSMGKLKQHLPPGVSPDNRLFLAMFLICLPHSMQEAVGAGTHMSAAAMVKAADALWDARGGHDPTVAAASTQRSNSPAPHTGKQGDKKNGNARSKSRPPSHPDFYSFQNPGNGICKFHNYYAHKAHRCATPCAWSENSLQKIPDSAPADVKAFLQKFPAIWRIGDVRPTPNHGVEHHIHTGSHPPVALIWTNCKLPKQSSKG